MRILRFLDKALAKILILLIRFYKVSFSLLFKMGGNRCRFYPDCSSYGLEALKIHGGVYGAYLTIKRVLKCGPFHPGGHDPVPPKVEGKKCECKLSDTNKKNV